MLVGSGSFIDNGLVCLSRGSLKRIHEVLAAHHSRDHGFLRRIREAMTDNAPWRCLACKQLRKSSATHCQDCKQPWQIVMDPTYVHNQKKTKVDSYAKAWSQDNHGWDSQQQWNRPRSKSRPQTPNQGRRSKSAAKTPKSTEGKGVPAFPGFPAHAIGILLHVVSIDIIIDKEFGNLRAPHTQAFWIQGIRSRWVHGFLGGPLFSTWSQARGAHIEPAAAHHRRAPRPVRSAAELWGLAALALRELDHVSAGNELLCFCLEALVELILQGMTGILQHPAEPDSAEAPIFLQRCQQMVSSDFGAHIGPDHAS